MTTIERLTCDVGAAAGEFQHDGAAKTGTDYPLAFRPDQFSENDPAKDGLGECLQANCHNSLSMGRLRRLSKTV